MAFHAIECISSRPHRPNASELKDLFLNSVLDSKPYKIKRHSREPQTVRVFLVEGEQIRKQHRFRDWSHGDIVVKVFTTKTEDTNPDRGAEREIGALQWLNRLGCAYVPRFLGSLKLHIKKGHKIQVVFMTKVPGVVQENLPSNLAGAECAMLDEAKNIAWRAVYKCGVQNGSDHHGNYIWNKDENKCYIIDFERAIFGESMPV